MGVCCKMVKITKHKCDVLYCGNSNVNDIAGVLVGYRTGTRKNNLIPIFMNQ